MDIFFEHFLDWGKLYLALYLVSLLVIGSYQWLRAVLYNDESQLEHDFSEDCVCILWAATAIFIFGVC